MNETVNESASVFASPDPNSPMRIGILTDSGSLYSPPAVLRIGESEVADVVAVWQRSSLDGAGLRRIIARSGLRYTVGRIIGGLKLAASDLYARQIKRTAMLDRPRVSLAEVASVLDVDVRTIASVNTPEFREELEALDIDMLVSIYFGEIVRPETLRAAGAILNVHPSLLPAYSGTNPIFWVLATGQQETGVSVHVMDEKVDTGPLVAQRTLEIRPDDTHHSLYRRLAPTAGEVVVDALIRFRAEGAFPRFDSPSEHSYFSHPTPEAYRDFRSAGRKFR